MIPKFGDKAKSGASNSRNAFYCKVKAQQRFSKISIHACTCKLEHSIRICRRIGVSQGSCDRNMTGADQQNCCKFQPPTPNTSHLSLHHVEICSRILLHKGHKGTIKYFTASHTISVLSFEAHNFCEGALENMDHELQVSWQQQNTTWIPNCTKYTQFARIQNNSLCVITDTDQHGSTANNQSVNNTPWSPHTKKQSLMPNWTLHLKLGSVHSANNPLWLLERRTRNFAQNLCSSFRIILCCC